MVDGTNESDETWPSRSPRLTSCVRSCQIATWPFAVFGFVVDDLTKNCLQRQKNNLNID